MPLTTAQTTPLIAGTRTISCRPGGTRSWPCWRAACAASRMTATASCGLMRSPARSADAASGSWACRRYRWSRSSARPDRRATSTGTSGPPPTGRENAGSSWHSRNGAGRRSRFPARATSRTRQAAGIGQAHLFGLSLGAAAGIWLAARHPDKVETLSLHSACTASDPFLRAVVETWQIMARALDSVPEMIIKGILPWCFTPELYTARPEYIELCFTTGEGAWNWCFPPPARELKRPAEPVALVLGPYGVLARRIADDGLGLALDSSVALPMILAGADVVVARRLVTAGR